MRVNLRCVLLLTSAASAFGCERGRASSARTPTFSGTVCAQLRAGLNVNPASLRAQRGAFRERATVRFGARAFEALHSTYGGGCADDADFRCVLQELPPFAFVECISPARNLPEALYADGPTLRRAEGIEAFELGVRSARPAPSQLEPLLGFFQRATRAQVLRDRAMAAAIVPVSDLEAMRPTSAALLPPTLVGGSAGFVAYQDQGYQAPRAFLEVRVDLARRTVAVERVELARRPYPQHRDPPPRVATTEGSRFDGSEGAVCAWG